MIIIILSIITYLMIAGAWANFLAGPTGGLDDTEVVMGVFWPFTVPFLAGSWILNNILNK